MCRTSQFTHPIFHVPNIQGTHSIRNGTVQSIDLCAPCVYDFTNFICFGIEYACVFFMCLHNRMCVLSVHCLCSQLTNGKKKKKKPMYSSAHNNGESVFGDWEMQSRHACA